jgi:vitamin B12 transporter
MINYGITFDYPEINLTSSLSANYFGERYVQDWDHAVNWVAPWVTFGGFTIVNFALSKQIIDFNDRGNLVLKTKIDNLFDRSYAYTLGYLLPGRSFYVGLEYNY